MVNIKLVYPTVPFSTMTAISPIKNPNEAENN